VPTPPSPRGPVRAAGWFANRPVSVKIAAAVLVVAVVAVAVGVTALLKMNTIATNGRHVYSQNLVPIVDLQKVQHALEEAKVDTAQYVLNMDRPEKQPERIRTSRTTTPRSTRRSPPTPGAT
jgi:methyl-accepting chemotaxis protein